MSQLSTLQIRALTLQLNLRLKSKRLLRLRLMPKLKKKNKDRQEKSVDRRVELPGKRDEEKDVPETKRRERTGVVP